MVDFIRPTPRNPFLGLLADAATKARDATGAVGDFLLGGAPETLDNASYGVSPVQFGETRNGLMGAINGMQVDPGVADIAGLLSGVPGVVRGGQFVGREALRAVDDAMMGGGRGLLSATVSGARPMSAMAYVPGRNTAFARNANDSPVVMGPMERGPTNLVRDVMDSFLGQRGRAGVRVLPPDSPGIGLGDILPPSNKWIDGASSDHSLFGTSTMGISDPTSVDDVTAALVRLGQIDRSPYRGYYIGDNVASVLGTNKRKGVDPGEWEIKNAHVKGVFPSIANGFDGYK